MLFTVIQFKFRWIETRYLQIEAKCRLITEDSEEEQRRRPSAEPSVDSEMPWWKNAMRERGGVGWGGSGGERCV